MKRLIYILFLGGIVLTSCDKPNLREQETAPKTVARALTFSAGFEQSVEPFDTRAASTNIKSLLVLLFDQNNILAEILWNGAGNTITKMVDCIPNQIYTVVYLANCRYSLMTNDQIKVGITKITDPYNIPSGTSGIPGGDLLGYGSQKRILTTDASIVTATLTPKMVKIRMQLPATEKPANKKYTFYYQSKMMTTMKLDGTDMTYYTAYYSVTETFTLINGQYIAYMRPVRNVSTDNSLLINIISYNSTSGAKLEEKQITTNPFITPQIGTSYLINITTKFPDAASPTRNGVSQIDTDTFILEPQK